MIGGGVRRRERTDVPATSQLSVLVAAIGVVLVGCDRGDDRAGHDQATAAAIAEATTVPVPLAVRSKSGRHVVEVERVGEGRYADLHEWRIRVLDEAGEVIPAGPIAFDGAMPTHKHGFDNRPLITGRGDDGWYRVEGVRFHMPGAWLLRVEFLGPDGMDRAELSLDVPY